MTNDKPTAASARAETATTKWNDEPDPSRDWYTTIAEIAASAIASMQQAHVAAAERKEVMPPAPPQPRPNDTAPPTAGPIPVAGALEAAARSALAALERDDSAWAAAQLNTALEALAPSPQPPAPPLAGADVAGLVEKLKRYANNIHSIGAQYTLTVDDATRAADALTAQAAEIERLQESSSAGWAIAKARAGLINEQAAALAAKEAECERLRERLRQAELRIGS